MFLTDIFNVVFNVVTSLTVLISKKPFTVVFYACETKQYIYIYIYPISHIYKVLHCITSVTCNWKWRVLSLFKFTFVYNSQENDVYITMVSVNNKGNLVLMENYFWLFLITLYCSLTRIVELVIVSCNWSDLDIIYKLISKLQLRIESET